ncbi:MAG: molybdopterin-dependent oxidoreductase [Christensenellales bacterium]|jgi:DMSO/TMAO reductase YedYZ molybdopterin-dependent catalytic subunit
MNKKTASVISLLTGVAALASGCSEQNQVAAPAPVAPAVAEKAQVTEGKLSVKEAATYNAIANVQGEFSFDQETVVPADDVFNIFGTAATALCAKPGFAFDEVERNDYYINIGGKIKKNATYTLAQLKEMEENTVMTCSCGTSGSVANADVTGVRIKNMLELCDVDEAANAITFKAADGYGLALPLSYVLEKDAMLVYKVGGKELSEGAQIWVPGTVAKYFTRQVVDIELETLDEEPGVITPDDSQRAKIGILNSVDADIFAVGDQIMFEGYADDCGVAIAAVEFSMDGGETWTSCPTENVNADNWVYWRFAYVCEEAGTFKLDVRAVTEEGVVSPMYSSVVFTVAEHPTDSM